MWLCPGLIAAQRGHAFGVHSFQSISLMRSRSVSFGSSWVAVYVEGSVWVHLATYSSIGDGVGTPSASGASWILHNLRPWPNWPHLLHLYGHLLQDLLVVWFLDLHMRHLCLHSVQGSSPISMGISARPQGRGGNGWGSGDVCAGLVYAGGKMVRALF